MVFAEIHEVREFVLQVCSQWKIGTDITAQGGLRACWLGPVWLETPHTPLKRRLESNTVRAITEQ